MFERFRNRVLSRGLRRDAGPAPAKRLIVEELEPWILMSADVAPAFDAFLSPLASEYETHELLVDSYGEISAPVVADVPTLRHEIVFVDTQVADYEQVVAGLECQSGDQRQIEVFLIDAGEDGVQRISDVLGARHDIDAVHIFSHGIDGAVELGGSWLNGAALQMQSESIAGWRSALSADADLLLYGCNIARDTEGKVFLDRLSDLTGADVAASDDATGAADLGGDWNLEVATGSIETASALDAGVQQNWAHVMAITVGNSSSSASVGQVLSLTWAHTVGAGSNGLLLVSLSVRTDTGAGASSVTYGGVALTKLGEDTSSKDHVEMWYLKVPAAGTANIVVTLGTTDTIAAGATNFFGIEQNASAYSSGSVVTANGTGNPSLTIASAAGELVVDGVSDRDVDSEVVGAGQTALFINKVGTGAGDAWVGSSHEAGAGSVTMSWTTNGAGGNEWAAVAIALKPATVAAPVVTLPGGSVSYTENGPATILDATATVTDSDSANFSGGTLTVDFSANGTVDDRLAIRNQGTGAGQIGVSGSNVTYGGVVIGTYTGGTGTTPLVVTFTTASATVAAAQALARNITYQNVSDTPSTAARTVRYVVNDGGGGTSVAVTKTVNVTAVNDAPTTTPVTLAPIAEDSGPRLITQAQLLVNATDLDGDALTASGLAISSGGGSLVNNGNGTWSYTPAANDNSSVSFSYTIGDGNGGSVAGSATLDITPVNDAPTTTPVTLAPIAEDSGARLITQAELLVNAADVDGDPLTASGLAISSGGGSLVNNGNGTWSYTPAANDNSSVSFSYTIGDGNGGTVAGSATLDLTPVNDAPTTTPVTLAPLAEDGGPRLITNAQLIANAADVDGDPLTATGLAIVSGSGTLVDNGNGTWTYTPAANDSSSVSFGYTIGDGNGGAVAGSATLDLTPVNDAPTTAPVTLAPLAEDGGPRLITNAELIANAADVDGDVLTATGLAITSGSGALVDNGNGTWTYTPAANDQSSVSFSYTIGDGNGGTVAGSATLDLTPVNDAPTTTPVTLAPLAEDGGPRLITNAQLIANAADVDGDPLTATGLAIVSGSGTLVDNGNGTWTYTPAANDSSSVSFGYTIADGNGGTVAGSATLDLTPVNDPPTTTPVTLAPLAEDGGPRLITNAQLVANATDVDGDPLTATALAIVSGAGTLVDNGNGTWTYTAAANDSSSVAFSYTIGDGNGGTVAGSATLDLTPVNDAPTTAPVTLAPLAEDGGPRLMTNAELVANAVDIDGDSLTATGLAIASGSGSLVDNGNGTWTYTPAANDSSSVSFSYTIADGNGGTVAGSATLDLTPVNDAPMTAPVALAPLSEDGGPRLITNAELIANAADVDGDPLTASALAIASGNGTLVDNGNGTWTYTPATDDSSSVTFSYTIGDGNGGTVAGSATLDLTPVNDAPTTSPVILAPLAEDGGPRLITNADLVANAADIDGDPLTATGLAIASGNGSLVDNGNGSWTYTPAVNDMSSVSFSYTIADGNGGSVSGSATLDLTPVNDAPTTAPVTLAPLAEDGGPRLITNAELVANATDIDGDALTATGLAIASGSGSLVDNGNGTWTYTPAANDSSSVSFGYTIADGNGGTVAGSATLDLIPVNDAPTTTPVTLAPLAEDGGPRLITNAELTANATDVEGDPLTATGLAIASGSGALVDNGNGTWTYTPAANDASSVSFSYTIADGNGGTVAGSATLDLTPVNDAPTTTPVTLAPLAEDGGPRLITNAQLVANATDVEGDPLTATGLAIASGSGALVDNGNGTWTYTPAANDESSVSFGYMIGDGNGGTVAGTATLDLTPVNDAPTTTPVTLAPLAEDGGPRLITNAELVANAADVDGDPLTATGLAIAGGNGSLVDNGDGTWTYTPAADDSSAVSFSYTIDDGNGGTVASSATLDLTPVNDVPTTSPVTLAPLAEDAGPRLITNAELVANASDIDGDALTATGLAIASGNGTLVDNGNGTWTYTPIANDSSSVSFSYTIGDGNGGTVAGTATLDLTPVNDAPTTTAVALAPLAEDGGPRLITSAELVANAADVDGDLLTASALAIASGSGSLVDNGNGTWTYTPAANDASSVTFNYTIADGNGGSVAGSASLDLIPVNDSPTTTPVTLAPLAEDGVARLITNAELIANAVDVDGDALTATGLAIASGNGSLVDNGDGTWTYTPAPNDSSSVAFSYTIGDGNGGSAAGSATLDLTPVNDAPTTTPVTLAPLAEDGGPRLITNAELVANAADVDGDLLTASALAIASGSGSLVDNGNGTWTYTSAANDASSVSFSYTIGDGNGGTVAGSATLDLTPVNDAPTTTPVTLTPLAEDGGPRLITNVELVANAVDVDGDSLTATGLAITSGNGALVDNGNGTWTYTPAANDSSSVSFSYTIADGNGGTIAGSATLDLTPVNDAPTTTPVTLAPLAEDGGPRLITNAELVANASDIDGDPLTSAGLAIASGNGTLVDNGNGTWTYTPAPNDSSSVGFSYTIADGNGGAVAGSATLDLTPVNDAPTTTPVALAPLPEDGGPRLITNAELVANASDLDGDALTAAGLVIVSGNGALVDNGNGTWTYTPGANDASSVSFSYTIGDGNSGTVAGSATLDLTPVNDAPATTPVTLAPLAEDGGARLITNAELTANATDIDGDPLTATGLAITSSNGTLVDNGDGTWTYAPAANDSSSVSFSYAIGDGNGGTVVGSATLDLLPANDVPTTSSVTLVPMAEDGGPRLIASAELLANAADLDGDALTPTGLAIASGNGTLVDNGNGTWTYTPAANDSGPIAFLYTIGDGNGGTVGGSAILDVTPVNDAPVVTSNGGGANANTGVAENTTAVTVVTSLDVDGDTVQYSIIGGADAARFLVDDATGALTFLAPPNYEAPTDAGGDNVYEVIVRAEDGQGGSTTQTLQIAVGGVDEAPAAGGDAFAITDNQLLIVMTTRLLANDADPEGDALQIVSLTSPLSGTLEQDASGGWRYTPAPGFTGNDRFTYTVADAGGRTATADVVIVVSPLTAEVGGGAAPTTTLAATSSAAPTGASGPLGGAVAANALGGSAVDVLDGTLASGPVDVAGADASGVWTVEAEEPPPGDGDDAVANFSAEIERQRVYDARHWAPPDQVELEQIAIDMNGNLLRLAMNMGLQDTSRSLAVFDETFQDMLDGVRRTDREVSEIAIGSGVAVGAGVIAWLLRGGALAASLLSVLPTWASFDPIPILARRRDDERKPTTPPPEDSSEAAVTRVLRPDALPPRQVRS